MLKNNGVLPFSSKKKVYIPMRYNPPADIFFGMMQTQGGYEYPFEMSYVKKHFEVVDNSQDADFALVGIKDPDGGNGYSENDLKNGGNGYMPINLQYSEYTAYNAREKSVSGGSPFEEFYNRSYRGKTVTSNNYTDMNLVNETKKKEELLSKFDLNLCKLTLKESSNKKYLSITLVKFMKNPDEVISKYLEISKIDGIISL